VHLAQLNVARLRAPMDDPQIDDFRNNLEPINALAEVSPGFVWRLQDDTGDATSIKLFEDELEIINLTVWESIEALADFTYRTAHYEFLRRRREFFEAPSEAYMCMWWIPEGTIPSPHEAIARLEHLRQHGPTPRAFTFRHRFGPDGAALPRGADRDVCPA
jgi:heme-degrading monooxygenase HmoA